MRIGTWRTAGVANGRGEKPKASPPPPVVEVSYPVSREDVFDLSNPQVWKSNACAMMREELTGCFCNVTAQ